MLDAIRIFFENAADENEQAQFKARRAWARFGFFLDDRTTREVLHAWAAAAGFSEPGMSKLHTLRRRLVTRLKCGMCPRCGTSNGMTLEARHAKQAVEGARRWPCASDGAFDFGCAERRKRGGAKLVTWAESIT